MLKEATKKGDLDAAVAIKSLIGNLRGDNEDGDKLVLISAEYGVDSRWVDCTKFFQKKIIDGKMEWQFDESELDKTVGDPAPSVDKTIKITYKFKGRNISKLCPFGRTISIPE